MICAKCGHGLPEGVAFCSYCGEKAAHCDSDSEIPLYQADVKTLSKSGKLVVYPNRTEFVVSSVQKTTFYYTGLVLVKKNVGNGIDFITEDGRTETCPADRNCVQVALDCIKQAAGPYLELRKEYLLSQGVRYSFPSSQGPLNDGILNLSCEQAEFRAKSGKNSVISYRDVKSVNVNGRTLDFKLFDRETKSYAVSKELQIEVLNFVNECIAPYSEQRKEDLLAQGIYFSSYGPDGEILDIRADRVEYKRWSGQVEDCVPFQDIRTADLYEEMLELALTDGTSRLFPIEKDAAVEILAFIEKAIEPYVAARTIGFDAEFGKDELIEFNGERGVFHLIRQGGREITGEWPIENLLQCEWTEDEKLATLGSMVSSGINLFKSAAKVAGRQTSVETEDKIGSVNVILTIGTDQDSQFQGICFGRSSMGMSRADKKYRQCLTEWANLSKYLRTRCPECKLIEPTVIRQGSTTTSPDTVEQQDDLDVAKFIENVSKFISDSPTPMTIAFQGNRDSGKNSILGMLFDKMKVQYEENLLWLNVRQFPQSESGESLSLLIGKKLLEQIKGESNTVKQVLTFVSGALTGVIVKDTSLGKDFADGVLNKGNQLRLFAEQIKTKTKKAKRKKGRVIFFIDGLDQIDPVRSVEILDAMRDFFECEGCVFVISANSEDISIGAQKHYNENKAKNFFAGVFKMQFRVPVSGLDVKCFVKGKLEDMGIQAGDNAELELYVALIQKSVGRNTDSIKRLFRSYQMLKRMSSGGVCEDRYKRLVLFALLCMQARFRYTYDYALRRRDNVTPELLAGLYDESAQPWDTDQTDTEIVAYRDFSGVFAQVINLDSKTMISESECQAFANMLELSSITY